MKSTSEAKVKRSRRGQNCSALLRIPTLFELDEGDIYNVLERASAREKQKLVQDLTSFHKTCLCHTATSDRMHVDLYTKFLLDFGAALDASFALSNYIEMSSFFESLGNIERSYEIANHALLWAEKVGNPELRRKAHARLGVCYSLRCDFEQSCIHYKKALVLAIQLKDALTQFAILSNVVTLFDSMGLLKEAKLLTIKLLDCADENEEFEALHLQNAINGFRYAREEGDFIFMSRFHDVARAKLQRVNSVPDIWLTNFQANHAQYLAVHQEPMHAKQYICEAMANTNKSNSHATIMLLEAAVECAFLDSNEAWLSELQLSLADQLNSLKSFPADYETALHLLARMNLPRPATNTSECSRSYARTLQGHLVNVKLKTFFSRFLHENTEKAIALELKNPFYSICLPVPTADAPYDASSSRDVKNYVNVDNILIRLEKALFNSESIEAEKEFRSPDYCLAENWAVAAESTMKKTGHHCFEVGKLCGKIALLLRYTRREALELELASRLHDIGRVTMAVEAQGRSVAGEADSYHYVREHTLNGYQLLSSSSDQVVRLAASIARSHHEWWNGCGFPDAVCGNAIPVEARICAVADAYLTFRTSCWHQTPWSHEAAVRQLTSMAGVQFDPEIVAALAPALEKDYDWRSGDASSDFMDRWAGRPNVLMTTCLG